MMLGLFYSKALTQELSNFRMWDIPAAGEFGKRKGRDAGAADDPKHEGIWDGQIPKRSWWGFRWGVENNQNNPGGEKNPPCPFCWIRESFPWGWEMGKGERERSQHDPETEWTLVLGTSIGITGVKECSPIEGKAFIPDFMVWMWVVAPSTLRLKPEFQTILPTCLEICILRGGRK